MNRKADRKAFAVFMFVSLCVAVVLAVRHVNAQTPVVHSVTLEYAGAGAADVYRADSGCDTAASFSKIAVAAMPPYIDAQVAGGDKKCYFILLNPTNIPVGFIEAQVPQTGAVVAKVIQTTISGAVQ